jgi:hypothetical protein
VSKNTVNIIFLVDAGNLVSLVGMTRGVLHACWFSLVFKMVTLHLITCYNLPCKWLNSQYGNTTIIPAVLTLSAPYMCL